MVVYVKKVLNFYSEAAKQTDTQRNSSMICWRRSDKLKVAH